MEWRWLHDTRGNDEGRQQPKQYPSDDSPRWPCPGGQSASLLQEETAFLHLRWDGCERQKQHDMVHYVPCCSPSSRWAIRFIKSIWQWIQIHVFKVEHLAQGCLQVSLGLWYFAQCHAKLESYAVRHLEDTWEPFLIGCQHCHSQRCTSSYCVIQM